MDQRSGVRPFPRGALLGAAALVVFALVAAAGARFSIDHSASISAADAALSRDLRFADQADGSVAVTFASDGRLLARIAPGTNGFMRSLMRGLARERRLNGIGAEPPFTLTMTREGHLVLQDPALGRLVDLGAFGPTNAQAFARLLDPEIRGS